MEVAPSYSGVPVTVAVGHTSPLVSAGLAATLARTPGCEVELWQIPLTAWDSERRRHAQVIFGDFALFEHLRMRTSDSANGCPLTRAKFVLVTTGDEPASNVAGGIDHCLSIECHEEQLFAIVQGMADSRARSVRSASSADEWSRSVPARERSSGEDRLRLSGDAARRHGGSVRPPQRRRTTVRGGLAPGALRRVLEHIERSFTENVQNSALAKIAGLSSKHFGRAFKQSTGASPHRYLMRQRVARATELLEHSSRALADIALDVGFADQSHFSRAFAALTGETPSACRRRHR
ncbi:MAG TPA: AraC family transcriptional regulator [Casimicrobiaceae bacterium]|nr:AraC family transcriptional regulator [Casimicrobiaceae bacterium]